MIEVSSAGTFHLAARAGGLPHCVDAIHEAAPQQNQFAALLVLPDEGSIHHHSILGVREPRCIAGTEQADWFAHIHKAARQPLNQPVSPGWK